MAETTPTKKKRLSLLNRIRSTRKSKGRGDADSIASGPSTPERAARAKLSFESTNRASSIIDLSPSLANSYAVIAKPKVSAIDIPLDQVWDHAYDRLKSDKPELVDHYEKILSIRLGNSQEASEGLAKNSISSNRDERQLQLDRLLQNALGQIEKHFSPKGDLHTALSIALSLKSAIDSSADAVTVPPVIWSALCVALEQLLSESENGSESNSKGITSVISKMKADSSLSVRVRQHKSSDDDKSLDSEQAEEVLVLYQEILKYAIESVCINDHTVSWSHSGSLVNSDDRLASSDKINEIRTSLQKSLGETHDMELGDSHSSEDHQAMKPYFVRDMAEETKALQLQKDPLLLESYEWALDTDEYNSFVDWHAENNKSLLWIRGDAGKGKTMLIPSILEDLKRQLQTHYNEPTLAYFFVRENDNEINAATSVLKGLIWGLLRQNKTLISKLPKDAAFLEQHDGPNGFDKFKEVFLTLIHDKALGRIYMVVDALNECQTDLSQLLHLISETSNNSKVKWIVSSRNQEPIEKELSSAPNIIELSLESHSEMVSKSINAFIGSKISELSQRYSQMFAKEGKSPGEIQELQGLFSNIQKELIRKANGSFTWVLQVSNKIQAYQAGEILQKLQDLKDNPVASLRGKTTKPTTVLQSADLNSLLLLVSNVFLILAFITFLVEHRATVSAIFRT